MHKGYGFFCLDHDKYHTWFDSKFVGIRKIIFDTFGDDITEFSGICPECGCSVKEPGCTLVLAEVWD